ncbi:hypothetical protein B0J14DRAFT_680709 [Halenospora varia]|nr:hypothetical protein B0J14DRAFT_680709 [Halenospora varia]
MREVSFGVKTRFGSNLWSATVLFSSLIAISAADFFSPAACSEASRYSIQCSALSDLIPAKVFYPSSTTYIASISSYFTQQSRLAPACIVTPSSTLEVALIAKTLKSIHDFDPDRSLFSIRSGGHFLVAGGANNNGGVTIDLRSIKSIDISKDTKIVSVGSGSLWKNIYAKLDPMNMTVSGGRVSGIGVGGYLTGGGISFLSPEHGWACDGVVGLEVVLADGQIVYASRNTHSDLFVALKGGSNNFGIVTRFDLELIKLGNFYGGTILYPISTLPQQLKAFSAFMDPSTFDKKATMIQAIAFDKASNIMAISNTIQYTLPVVDAPAIKSFTSIQPQLINTMRISNMSDFVSAQDSVQPLDTRVIYATTVFYPTLALLTKVCDLFMQTFDQVQNVAGITHALVIQRLPSTIPGKQNSLGLGPDAGYLVQLSLSTSWSNKSDDHLIDDMAKRLLGDIGVVTKAANAYDDFKYLNYAASWQDPFASYGFANLENLWKVSRKYDPTGLFQTGVPGGFKLKPTSG